MLQIRISTEIKEDLCYKKNYSTLCQLNRFNAKCTGVGVLTYSSVWREGKEFSGITAMGIKFSNFIQQFFVKKQKRIVMGQLFKKKKNNTSKWEKIKHIYTWIQLDIRTMARRRSFIYNLKLEEVVTTITIYAINNWTKIEVKKAIFWIPFFKTGLNINMGKFCGDRCPFRRRKTCCQK